MILIGHTKGNKIILDDNINFPDGLQVKVSIIQPIKQDASGLCGIWKDDRPVEKIVDDIISSRSEGRNINI